MKNRNVRSWLVAAAICATVMSAAACSKSADTSTAASDASAAASTAATASTPNPGSGAAAIKIRIVTSDGTIAASLDPSHAPKTVANYLHYVDTKFFNGGTFFRAVPNFVIQGGNKTKESPSDKPVVLEDTAVTGLHNVDGSLAMARTSDPNSATSEFFIDIGPQAFLDGGNGQPGYAVFGSVTSGMDIVKKIVSGPATGQMLAAPVKILKIERVP